MLARCPVHMDGCVRFAVGPRRRSRAGFPSPSLLFVRRSRLQANRPTNGIKSMPSAKKEAKKALRTLKRAQSAARAPSTAKPAEFVVEIEPLSPPLQRAGDGWGRSCGTYAEHPRRVPTRCWAGCWMGATLPGRRSACASTARRCSRPRRSRGALRRRRYAPHAFAAALRAARWSEGWHPLFSQQPHEHARQGG